MKIPAVNLDCAYRFNTSATDLKLVGNAHPTVYQRFRRFPKANFLCH